MSNQSQNQRGHIEFVMLRSEKFLKIIRMRHIVMVIHPKMIFSNFKIIPHSHNIDFHDSDDLTCDLCHTVNNMKY